MKTYADVNYYKDSFFGDKIIIEEKELEKFLVLASQKIDEITYNRIISIGFGRLTDFQKEKIKDAVCYQANYILENGTDGSDIKGYSILDINISVGDKKSLAAQKNMSDVAFNLIKQTGLSSGIL